MRKVHYKVVLDILIHEEDDVNIGNRLRESGFIIDPEQDAVEPVGDVINVTVESVNVTDSR